MLFRVVVPVAVGASLVGIRQAIVGFFPFELEALHRQVRGVIHISGVEWRPMGFFPSGAEYTQYLSIAIVVPLAALFAGRIRLALCGVPIVGAALFLSGIRGPVVSSAVTIVAIWAMVGRKASTGILRMSFAACIVFGGLTWGLTHIDTSDLSPQVSSLVGHQVEGIVNIADDHKSSATGQTVAIWYGITRSLVHHLAAGWVQLVWRRDDSAGSRTTRK